MELTNDVYNSINRYFKSLTHMGYKPDSEVNKLLVFIFIEEMLDEGYEFITEEDYKIISSVLECMYGSCLTPYPNYKKEYTPALKTLDRKYRFIGNRMRVTESSDIRTV